METPTLLVSFLAGIVLFASPCVAPLIPAYMASIAGVRLSDLAVESGSRRRALQRTILKNAIIFVLGFSLVFILLGSFIGYLSSLILGFQLWLNRVGGALIIVLAFHMLGLVRIPVLDREANIAAPRSSDGSLKSAVMGASFGISWTPCTGPVLGAILALSATTASLAHSATLMTAFSAGLALPFLATGIFTTGMARFLANAPHVLGWMNRVGGVFLLALGVIVFSGQLQKIIGIFYNWVA